jgi:hypothetical protein
MRQRNLRVQEDVQVETFAVLPGRTTLGSASFLPGHNAMEMAVAARMTATMVCAHSPSISGFAAIS